VGKGIPTRYLLLIKKGNMPLRVMDNHKEEAKGRSPRRGIPFGNGQDWPAREKRVSVTTLLDEQRGFHQGESLEKRNDAHATGSAGVRETTTKNHRNLIASA